MYTNMHYEKRVRSKKRLPARVKIPLEQPSDPHTTWSLDFGWEGTGTEHNG